METEKSTTNIAVPSKSFPHLPFVKLYYPIWFALKGNHIQITLIERIMTRVISCLLLLEKEISHAKQRTEEKLGKGYEVHFQERIQSPSLRT